ncbi:hypothetical protein GXW82_13085 [Streptacidiphilus sp. 4-A2]|nr:hypothetical protein [Streptacidiphilus sp. 4-A2]
MTWAFSDHSANSDQTWVKLCAPWSATVVPFRTPCAWNSRRSEPTCSRSRW